MVWGLYVALAIVTTAALAGDNTIGATVNGVEISKSTPPNRPEGSDDTTRTACMNHCASADTRCGSEVRRARSDCSRLAASGGRDPFGSTRGTMTSGPMTNQPQARDPMTGRTYNYAYFCDYFNNPGRACGNDRYAQACQMRFANRYNICVEVMDNNVASAKYDCYKSEKDAQNYCRDELRDCQAACK
jgi:hypothetical protein